MSSLAIQTLSSSRLYSLTVDYFSNDYDILDRVAMAVPNLRKLKLNEKHHPQRHHDHARRPWNDLRSWHLTLLRLVHLEELMVRTLVSIPNQDTEPGSNGQLLSHWFKGAAGEWSRVAIRNISRTQTFTL
ncbi:hypothetical protein C8Q79DRAFT_925854 [Trametes meyenii]|nr:hypothetical protein C8Q79DRAFT_925854 [Trametes meyenii]